jgi:hypothetical protein
VRKSLAAVLIPILATFCLVSCSKSPSYSSFTHRDQAYFSKIAVACDEIRQRTPVSTADGRHLSPNSALLPAVLNDIHPDYFYVTTNRVFMIVGTGRGGYGIAWESTGGYGELRTYAEGLETVLFKTVLFGKANP